MKTDFIKRKKCTLCNSVNIKNVFDFGKTPLANSYLKKKQKNKFFPLSLSLCKACGHLQLNEIVNPKIMFENYSYVSGTSKILIKHFEDYSKKLINSFKPKNNDKILDIACNDGTFLKQFINQGYENVIGIEPAKNLKNINKKNGIDINTIFFNFIESKKLKKKYNSFKIITANNVCAHIPSMNSFTQGISNILDKESIFVFEVSYLLDVYKKMTFDTMYHEHISYHSLKPLIKFFKKYDLEIFNFDLVEAQGGSIRIYVAKKNCQKVNIKKISKQIKKEEKLKLFETKSFLAYFKKLQIVKYKLNKILDTLKRNEETIVGFGAPAKLTTFSYFFEIDRSKVDFIIDDNPLKQRKYSPGKKIPIMNYKFLQKNKWDVIIVFAWNFSESIIKRLKKDFSNKKIIIPFPEPRIIKI